MKTQYVILGFIGILLVSGGLIFFKGQLTSKALPSEKNSSSVKFQSHYLTYSPENLAKAQANNGKAVIFFHAGWCSSCQAAEQDFKANFDKVPTDVTILKQITIHQSS